MQARPEQRPVASVVYFQHKFISNKHNNVIRHPSHPILRAMRTDYLLLSFQPIFNIGGDLALKTLQDSALKFLFSCVSNSVSQCMCIVL